MRHYDDAFNRIIEMSKLPKERQRFFLVREPTNPYDKNAVMLHDGVRKLGHVAATEAIRINKIIQKLVADTNNEQVLIATIKPKTEEFRWVSSFSFEIIGHVYERYARKFGQIF